MDVITPNHHEAGSFCQIDIVDQDSGDVARINGYVRMMQAQEPHPEAETIQMLIRFVDDDEDKLAVLSRFIAKVR